MHRSTRNRLLSTAAIAILLGAVVWAWFGDPAERAPDVTFETLDGERIELAALRERPVMVYFWATDCVTCMREMPDLVALYEELRDDGFELLAVALSHDRIEDLEEVRAERELPFPVIFDEHGEHARSFGNVRVTPTKFLIGPDGRIRMRHIGASSRDALQARIEALN